MPKPKPIRAFILICIDGCTQASAAILDHAFDRTIRAWQYLVDTDDAEYDVHRNDAGELWINSFEIVE